VLGNNRKDHYLLYITYDVPFPYCCMYLCVPAASGKFTSFPLSAQLKGILATEQNERQQFSLSVFAMRLAAQETRQRWYSYDIVALHEEDHINTHYIHDIFI